MTFRLDPHDLSDIELRAETLAADTSPETAEIFINALRKEHSMFGAELGREQIEEIVDHFIKLHPVLVPFRWSLMETVIRGAQHDAAEALAQEMREVALGHLTSSARWTLRPVLTNDIDYRFKVVFFSLPEAGSRELWKASSATCEFGSLSSARSFASDKLGQLAGVVFPDICDETVRSNPILNYNVEVIHASGATVMVLESEEVAGIEALEGGDPEADLDTQEPEEDVKVTGIVDQISSAEEARRIVAALTERHLLEG